MCDFVDYPYMCTSEYVRFT